MFAANVSRHNPAELQAKCQPLTLPAVSWINNGYWRRLHFKVALYSYLAREAWAPKWRERASV